MGYSDELPDVPGLCHTRKMHLGDIPIAVLNSNHMQLLGTANSDHSAALGRFSTTVGRPTGNPLSDTQSPLPSVL
jgi:hypothetical protein